MCREMENLIERMVIMADKDEIAPGYCRLFSANWQTEQGSEPMSRIEEIEIKEIVAALERNTWNRTHTARDLGITLRQITYRIKKFGLDKALEEGAVSRSSRATPWNRAAQ